MTRHKWDRAGQLAQALYNDAGGIRRCSKCGVYTRIVEGRGRWRSVRIKQFSAGGITWTAEKLPCLEAT